MRFVTFSHDGVERAGVLAGDGASEYDTVFDLAHAAMRPALKGAAPTVAALVDAGLDQVARAIADRGLPADASFGLREIALSAPIPRPRRIIGVAHNYRDAIRERGIEPPAAPVLFDKRPETVVGPGADVVLPAGIGGVTYEAELAVVIGKAGRSIAPADAMAHVVAAAAFNDISASELIRKDGRFDRGKNFPTFGPFGPYLATLDELGDLQALAVSFEMDGVTLQQSSTAEMLFGVAELIAIISRDTALAPGDIIATGTPAGVAPLRQPPTWIRPGSIFSVSVEGLGTLHNMAVEGEPFHD